MRRWKKQVDGALEKERAERRSLFAGQRIGPFRHGRAALVVDEEAPHWMVQNNMPDR